MNTLLAVTKKRRNLIRIEKAFTTDFKRAFYERDEFRALKAKRQRERLRLDVARIFAADCKAAL